MFHSRKFAIPLALAVSLSACGGAGEGSFAPTSSNASTQNFIVRNANGSETIHVDGQVATTPAVALPIGSTISFPWAKMTLVSSTETDFTLSNGETGSVAVYAAGVTAMSMKRWGNNVLVLDPDRGRLVMSKDEAAAKYKPLIVVSRTAACQDAQAQVGIDQANATAASIALGAAIAAAGLADIATLGVAVLTSFGLLGLYEAVQAANQQLQLDQSRAANACAGG